MSGWQEKKRSVWAWKALFAAFWIQCINIDVWKAKPDRYASWQMKQTNGIWKVDRCDRIPGRIAVKLHQEHFCFTYLWLHVPVFALLTCSHLVFPGSKLTILLHLFQKQGMNVMIYFGEHNIGQGSAYGNSHTDNKVPFFCNIQLHRKKLDLVLKITESNLLSLGHSHSAKRKNEFHSLKVRENVWGLHLHNTVCKTQQHRDKTKC